MRLDRLLAKHSLQGKKMASRWLAAGTVSVNHQISKDGSTEVSRFSHVAIGDLVIQSGQAALYLLLHKPSGILSATKDAQHKTVLDLLDLPTKNELHLVGRLDRSSSGLILLTNDGRWSKRLMDPYKKVPKTYLVGTSEPIPNVAEAAFLEGFYFHTEDITTLPAKLVRLGTHTARVTLHEGRYHQIKRMFHRVGCRVTSLHRESLGNIVLPPNLKPGEWRELNPDEVAQASLARP